MGVTGFFLAWIGILIGVSLDPFKLGLAVYFFFKPKDFLTVILISGLLGGVIAIIFSTIAMAFIAHIVSAVALAATGNFLGLRRLKGNRDIQ